MPVSTDDAIALFKKQASEYLTMPTVQLAKLLEQLGLYPLHPFFTAHIRDDIFTLSQFVRVIDKVHRIEEILERFLEKFSAEKAISFDDVVHLFERKGEEFSMQEMEQFFKQSDTDGDGFIGLHDLRQILGVPQPQAAIEAPDAQNEPE